MVDWKTVQQNTKESDQNYTNQHAAKRIKKKKKYPEKDNIKRKKKKNRKIVRRRTHLKQITKKHPRSRIGNLL